MYNHCLSISFLILENVYILFGFTYTSWTLFYFILFYFFYMDSFLGGVYIYTHTHGYLVYFFNHLPIVWFSDLVFPSPTYGTYNVTSMLFTLFFFFLIIRLNRFCIFVAFVWANFLKFDIFYMLMVWESMVKYY